MFGPKKHPVLVITPEDVRMADENNKSALLEALKTAPNQKLAQFLETNGVDTTELDPADMPGIRNAILAEYESMRPDEFEGIDTSAIIDPAKLVTSDLLAERAVNAENSKRGNAVITGGLFASGLVAAYMALGSPFFDNEPATDTSPPTSKIAVDFTGNATAPGLVAVSPPLASETAPARHVENITPMPRPPGHS